jgi:hypothetical protein
MARAPLAGSLGLTPFYDCSWTLYHCFWKKSAVRDGLLAESSRGRERLARRLEEALRNMREESDEDEEPDQRSSQLEKFSVELLSTRNINGVSAGISVTANYERGSEHRFIFIDGLGARVNRLPLLLIKAPAGVAKKVSAVLSTDVAVGPLKLPSSALETTLDSYLTDLHGQSSDLCKSVVRDVKVTFSVQAPVSPELRSIDIDLPAESVCAILDSHRSSSFLEQLAVHLQRHTGLKIPHDSTGECTLSKTPQVEF